MIVDGNVPELLPRPPDRRARPGDDGRRHQVPRPVRRAHQGGHERGPPGQEHDPVHRRAAHAGRRRRRRRARSTPPTCSSRPWPAARSSASAPPRSTSTASTSRRTRALDRRFQDDHRRAADARPRRSRSSSGLRDRYEAHHRVQITDDALEAAVELSDRYITGRCLPDKAIDVIDEAGARVRLKAMTRPPDLKEIDDADRAAQPGEGRGGRQPGLREGRRACATRPTSSRRRRRRSPASGARSPRRSTASSTRKSSPRSSAR